MRTLLSATLLTALCASTLVPQTLGAQTASAHPRDKEIHDPDTLAWWHTTEALAGDAMEGRDTGSAAYLRAAEYVQARFKAAGYTFYYRLVEAVANAPERPVFLPGSQFAGK
jgi:hypothetical protein